MSRPLVLSVLSLAVLGGTAHAFTPIPFAEVKGLHGTVVYVADSVELDRKGPVWVFAGEPVTLDSCSKSTTTVTLPDQSKVSGWRYGRCKVTTSAGATGSLQLGQLSQKPLRYNLRKPGTPAALRRAAFEEAFETALAMVAFAKAHEAELGANIVTSKLDNENVIGELDLRWQAMATAQQVAQRLHRELVVGSRLTTESAMREAKHAWVVEAKDMLAAWTKGAAAGDRKRLEAGMSCLGKLNGVAAWGTLSTRIRDELAARSWRRGVKSGSEDQLVALDKENEARLTKRLKDQHAAFQQQLAQAQAMRRTLTW